MLLKILSAPLITFGLAASTFAQAENAITRIGAINWDCSRPSTTMFGSYATRSLGPSRFRDRTPYYAKIVEDERIDFADRTVEDYSVELQYAIDAGIDYFAYCWYDRTPCATHLDGTSETASADAHVHELARARILYERSPLRHKLNYCAILVVCHQYSDAELRALAVAMKEPYYEKIGSRPLVYFFMGKVASPLGRLRRFCREVGAGDPYAVLMVNTPTLPTDDDLSGIQAYSAYATGGQAVTYAEVAERTIQRNAGRAALGKPTIPLFSCGWDPTPRILHPVPWGHYAQGSYVYAPPATMEELVSAAACLRRWVSENVAACPTGHVLAFAWNEFEEGGWICPNIGSDGKVEFSRRDAFAAAVAAMKSGIGPDLFIGTEGNGHVSPAACVPFGLVQAGPDTGTGAWKYCGGYQYSDDSILGFSQTHLSGTGCPDLGDVSVMPFTGPFDPPLTSRFGKDDEKAGPGWYETKLARYGIGVRVTATEHVALYSFSYPTGTVARLHVNLPFAIHYPQSSGFAHCRWHRCGSHFADSSTLVGCYERTVWNRRKVGFAVRFDHQPSAVREIQAVEGVGPSQYLVDFDLRPGEDLRVKVALSATDSDAALGNLEAEAKGWDFDGVRQQAETKWANVLACADVEGDPACVTSFKTALYRLCVQPNNIADAGKPPFYSTFSCWDTYRAAHPLYTLLFPERVQGMVDSMLRQGEKTGYLPIWTLWGGENQCMIGTHSIPIIVDAWLKGVWKGDASVVFEQIKDTLKAKHPGRRKEDWDVLDKYGYYPFDVIRGESVSRTLECAYDDWCAARMAKGLGKEDDADFFMRRSENWRNVFDPELKLMRGRDRAGNWRSPFNPFALGHGANSGNDFTEGNSWQYTWHVQQNPEGLVGAFGGKEAFAAQLETLFTQSSQAEGQGNENDVSGLIGQYAHGNEPSHHAIYLFQYADRGDLTAKYVRQVFDTQYGTAPDGLCGNDDCGQMSAWYVFSAMGFYPLNPCGGDYVLGAPQLDRVALRLCNGRTFTVAARNRSKANLYVKSVTLNGKRLEGFILRHADILKGGELVFEMTGEKSPQ